MTCFRNAIVVAMLTVAASGVAIGQSAGGGASSDTTALGWAKRLLTSMHSQDALVAGVDSAFAADRRAGTQQVQGFVFDSIAARIHRTAPEVIDSLAIVYARLLSLQDLKDLVRFYESPLGQRFAAAQIAFQFQAMALGKRWGMRVALDVMKDLVDKGLLPDVSH